jgi:hypothetical protein
MKAITEAKSSCWRVNSVIDSRVTFPRGFGSGPSECRRCAVVGDEAS